MIWWQEVTDPLPAGGRERPGGKTKLPVLQFQTLLLWIVMWKRGCRYYRWLSEVKSSTTRVILWTWWTVPATYMIRGISNDIVEPKVDQASRNDKRTQSEVQKSRVLLRGQFGQKTCIFLRLHQTGRETHPRWFVATTGVINPLLVAQLSCVFHHRGHCLAQGFALCSYNNTHTHVLSRL